MQKKYKICTLIVLSSVLVACSNSPSDSEVKKAFLKQKELTDCKYGTLEDFTRTNGIKGDSDNVYRVAYKATIKLHYSVLQEFHGKWGEESKAYTAFTDQNQKEQRVILDKKDAISVAAYNENAKLISGDPESFLKEHPDFDSNKWKAEWIKKTYPDSEKYDEELNQLSSIAEAKWASYSAGNTAIRQEASKKINEGCLNPAGISFKIDWTKPEDQTMTFTADQNFIKTENGWVLDL